MSGVITSIGKGKRTETVFQRLSRQAIAPPFFLVGIIAGFMGSAYQGVHLWLQLSGQMELGANFVFMRKAHAAMQLLLFLGAFVSGFLLQAMPKLVETSHLRPLGAILLLPLFIIGALLIFFAPFDPLGYWLIASHFAIVTVLAVKFAALAPRHALYRAGVPIAWATGWLSAGALMDLSHPVAGLLVFWGAFVPLIEVTVRRVFFGLIKIKPEKNLPSQKVAMCYVAAMLSGSAYYFLGFAAFWNIFAVFSLLTAIFFVQPRLPKSISAEPFPLAFWFGMLWLFVGLVLLFFGPASADAVLHTWAIGLALPLVLVVAPQVVRGHMGVQVFSPRWHVILLLLWQLVPLCRGPGRYFFFPGWVSSVVGTIAAAILLTWSLAMCAGLIRGWMKPRS